MPLRDQNIVAFLATENAPKSRDFFEKVIGLELVEETDFALVFLVGSGQLRIQKVTGISLQPYTSLGWQVDDIEAVVESLANKGVVFDHHEGMVQDTAGIWTSPSGAKVAWFKDPDGNTLSLTQH
jgi:catechol 2,3-dioxygenase-like lactoylglutathione lyase family enzyme